MESNNSMIEQEIAKRFNELSETQIVSDFADENNFEINEVFNFFSNVKGKKILDVGCGKGKFSRILVQKGAIITGIDPSLKLLEYTKDIKDGKFQIGTATDLRFEDEEFDYVFAIEVIEHIPEYKRAIREMVRVLKKGGKICIIDKNIIGLTYRFLFPFLLLKKIKEYTNNWMYPKDFPFKEKWFFPWEVKQELDKYCSKTFIRYLRMVEDKNIKNIFKIAPYFNLVVSWRGIK